MTSVREHKRKIKEHLDEINDAIDVGIIKKPITIGFHCSACAAELLELYLHLLNKITGGKQIKHTWFKRPQRGQKKNALPERKIGVNFPKKDEIYFLMYKIEEERNSLVYGKAGKIQIKKVLSSFQKLRKIIQKEIEKSGESIE